jgi:hypothetical protein
MGSHTGAVPSLGKGAVYGMSNKQKINTKSSCEAELVGVDDALPMVLWTVQFLKAQGFEVADVVYQDNQSSIKILLEKNGTRSSGRGTRHLNIRCFFITDRGGPILTPRHYKGDCSGSIEIGYLTFQRPQPSRCRSVLDPNLFANKSDIQLDDSVQSDGSDDVVTRFDCDEVGWTTVV